MHMCLKDTWPLGDSAKNRKFENMLICSALWKKTNKQEEKVV